MRTRGIESALDKCLSCLRKGDSIEACLAQHPNFSDELEPLLPAALRAQQLRESRALPQAALAAGRSEFLCQAAALRDSRAQAQKRQGIFSRLSDGLRATWNSLTMRKGALTIMVTALLLFGLLSGGTMASANSLPGDPLYPLKRVSEQVQLALTFGEETKAELLTSFEKRRVEEVQSVVEVRRIVNVRFKGTLELLEGSAWTVSGINVVVPADTQILGTPLIGRDVWVQARTQTDGRVVAHYVRVIEPVEKPPTQTPLPATATATTQPTETEKIEPSPTPVVPTKEPAATEAPHKEKPKPTATEEPTPTSELTGTPTITPTPDPTIPEPTREPPPREVKVKFEGQIIEISSTLWVIGEHSVLLDTNTQVQEKNGRAEVGAWANVIAIRQQDDSLLAVEIVIERPSEIHGEPVEFRGVIEQIGDTEWVIEGRSVRIDETTVIEGTPEVGSLAEVKGLRLADNSIVAQHIVVKPPELQDVEFEGLIESFSDTIWIVAGHSIVIDAETTILGDPAIGLSAEVKALLLPDGTILARHIRVESTEPEPSPTSTTTATATATATAAATAAPTLEPTEETPTEEPPESTVTPLPATCSKVGIFTHRTKAE